MANINSKPRFMLMSGYGRSNGIHIVRAKGRARTGPIIHTDTDDVRVVMVL